MDRKTFGIGILSLTAVILLVANYLPKTAAVGAMAVKDRDYQAVTAHNQQGGETLYIVDNRTGLMGVFAYDPGTRTVVPRDVKPVAQAFVAR